MQRLSTEAGTRLLDFLAGRVIIDDEDWRTMWTAEIRAVEREARAQGILHQTLAAEAELERLIDLLALVRAALKPAIGLAKSVGDAELVTRLEAAREAIDHA